MENYTLEFPQKGLLYQADVYDFYISNGAIINCFEETFYSHNLEVTNLFLKEIKQIFVNPSFKSKTIKKISEDFFRGNVLVLEIDFQMIKYKPEEASKVILEENNKGRISQFTNMLAMLEPCIASSKHYLLKYTKSGLQKSLVSEIK